MNTKIWDVSIIGITPDDVAEMSVEEQEDRAIDECNRAADILQAVVAAFGEHFRPSERRALLEAAVEIIKVTRVERPRDASISADEAHDEGYSN